MDSKLTAQAQPSDYHNGHDDEIDLFELWNGLVQEKWTIVLSFAVAVLFAAAYAFTATPVYQSDTYLLPPQTEKVLPMNELAIVLSANANVNVNTAESVFNKFQENLESRQTLKVIFDQYRLITLYQTDSDQLSDLDKIKAEKHAFANFIKDFSIKRASAKELSKEVVVSLSLSLTEQEVAVILNELVKTAEQKTIEQFHQQIVAEKQSRVRLLNDRISSIKQVALDKRLDRIAQLDEAITITEKLDLNKPVTAGPTLYINNVNTETGYNTALYLLGSDLLIAERVVLESRKNDDSFIPQLRDLQEQLQKLKALKIDPAEFGVVRIDQTATYGDKIKPKKALILAVAGVLGLMLGVFIALIRRAVKNRAQESLPTA